MAVRSVVWRTATLQLYMASLLHAHLGAEASSLIFGPDSLKSSFEEDWQWAADNVPLFESSDSDITAAYAFRWRVYKRHIHREAGPGHVVTEFLPPVSWAGPYNTIAGSAGHHIYEGRWLRNSAVMDDYSRFWFSKEATPRAYTAWLTNAIYARALVDGRFQVAISLLDEMAANLKAWRATHFHETEGCFIQSDTWDGGEDSISGGGCRVSINSVMYGEMIALADIQQQAGRLDEAAETRATASAFREHVLQLFWDPHLQFFAGYKTGAKTLPAADLRDLRSRCSGAPEWRPGARVLVRELLALSTPFYFNLVPEDQRELSANYSRTWDQLFDPDGFAAEWGPRTAERRHPDYNFSCDHPCTWNGPSWPFETARVLTGLANFLSRDTAEASVGPSHWMSLMRQYARVHTRSRVLQPSDLAGRPVAEHPWIGEDIHPDEGYWVARDYMQRHGESDWRRGYMYNHATFCDLVITGLVGLRPRADDVLELRPLADATDMPWFALDGVAYHGRLLTIAWDADGQRYGRGIGLSVWMSGELLVTQPDLAPLLVRMPRPSASLELPVKP